ncbi:MAG: HEAT repeat domain-containing protein [Phycisphaerae bacterium]|nr:HEAT repeat domain-containing protein [Gemmatimonadaceae bacterium]
MRVNGHAAAYRQLLVGSAWALLGVVVVLAVVTWKLFSQGGSTPADVLRDLRSHKPHLRAHALGVARRDSLVGLLPCDQLIASLVDEDPRVQSAAAPVVGLALTQGRCWPPYFKLMDTTINDAHRERLLNVVSGVGPAVAAASRRSLLRALDGAPVTRLPAVNALARTADRHPSIIRALHRSLQDTAGAVRSASLSALSDIAPNCRTLSALRSALRDPRAEVRDVASWNLGRTDTLVQNECRSRHEVLHDRF